MIDLEEYEAMMRVTKSEFKKLKYPTNRNLICKRRHPNEMMYRRPERSTLKLEVKQELQ